MWAKHGESKELSRSVIYPGSPQVSNMIPADLEIPTLNHSALLPLNTHMLFFKTMFLLQLHFFFKMLPLLRTP